MNNLKEQLQEDIIAFIYGYGLPPFVCGQDDKEAMIDGLCEIVVDRISEAQNNG